MMKKFFKGFTLVELIIVMAILTVLMAAIMRMFKPIRETYVDATLYENQRSVQNGIVQYVNESLRYATDVGIYNTPDKSSMQQAVEEFADAYCHKNSSADKNTVMKNAEVIIIDNKENYTFNGKNCTGRLLRRNNVGDASLSETNTRLALGAAYYGENSYAIKITQPVENIAGTPGVTSGEVTAAALDWRADEGIKITVASTASYGQRQLQKSEGFGFNNKLIHTDGWVVCPNLSKLGGLFDVQNDTDRTNIENAKSGGGGGGGTPTPDPPTPSGDKSPSGKGDTVNINGVKSDETVDAYNPTGGPGGGSGGGGSGGGSYSDSSKYDEINANAPGSKVYIVFLKK